jgi:hypothetical protein
MRAAALCGLAMVGMGGTAYAQRTGLEVNSVALKVGAFLPSKSDAKRGGGDSLLSLEADYVVQSFPSVNLSNVVSVGLIERDNLRIVPLTLSQIYHDLRQTTSYSVYYGYGLGLYSARLNIAETSGNTKLLFGGSFVAGFNVGSSSFVEAKYHYISKYDQKFIGGVQFMVGTRF